MAVEIPVVIDIEGAAKDAARRAPQALEILESALDKKILKIKIQIDKGNVRSVKDILSSSTMSAEDLLSALKNVEIQMEKLSASGGRGASTKVRQLASAYDALRLKYTQLAEAETRAANASQRLSYSHEKAASSANRVRIATREINDELKTSDSRIVGLIKNSIRLLALHSATRFIRNVRDVTAEFELQKVALGSIIRDTERASSLFRQIKAAAIESPFEIKDLVTYTKQLSAYQIETEKLFDTTMKLADVSAGLGVDMSRLILAYGQVRAASVLRGQELRQFTEAGIPLVEKLADKLTELNHRTVTTAEVFELISKRAVQFRMIEEIFDDMTSAGGMFYKMQEKQAETLQGQWNNLKDAISIMYDEIGRTKTVHNAMETLISDARWLMQNWRSFADVIKIVGSGLVAYVAITKSVVVWDRLVAAAEKAALGAVSTRELAIRRVTAALIGETAAQKLATKAATLYATAIFRAGTATTAFGATLWNLVAILASNPFGIAAVAVGALAGYLIKLSKSSISAEESVDKANKSIQQLSKARENDQLVKQYEELSKKTKLAAKETAALRDISRELGKTFPLTTKAIDNQTGALKLNIKELKQYSADAQQTLKDLMAGTIAENNTQIKKNERKQKHIQDVLARGYGFVDGSFYFNLSSDVKAADALRVKLLETSDATRGLVQSNQDLQDAIDGVVKTGDKNDPYPPIPDKDKLKGLRDEISLITDAYKKYIDLLKYMSRESALKNIESFFPSLNGMEPTLENTIARITGLSSKFKGADAERIIEQAVANLRFDALKKHTADELQRISDEIKRSETAKNFFKNILDLTGNEDLAASLTVSVYGGVGEDFKDRMQKELYAAIKGLDSSQLSDELKEEMIGAIAVMDSAYMRESIKNLPDNVRKMFEKSLDEYDKYNADVAKDYAELLMKYQDVQNKRKTIEDQANKKITSLREGLKKELMAINADITVAEQTDAGKAATARVNAAIDAVDRERKLELLRNSRDYRLFFETIGSISLESARKIANAERDIVIAQFEAGQLSLSQYNREIDRIEERLKKYEQDKNPLVTYLTGGLDALFDKFQQESRNLVAMAGNLKDDEGNFAVPEALEKTVNMLGKIFGGKIFGVSGRKNVFDQMTKQLGDNEKMWQDTLNSASAKIAAFSSDFAQGFGWADFWVSLVGNGIKAFDELAEYGRNSAGEVEEGWNELAKIVWFTGAGPIPGLGWFVNWKLFKGELDDDAWDRFASMNNYAMEGFEKLKKGDIIGSLVDNIKAWSEVLGKNTKKIDRQIKEQSDTLEDLDYQYGRLEKSIQKAFGSDYIADYNKQLDVLYAKQEAYLQQARLEESKGKKKDQTKIDDYVKNARAVADQIADMQGQVAEFITGTDLTSAAKDFATAWIDAYKEFGSTTDAMKEKFQDMVQEMITNSLAARVMQNLLSPIFDMVDELAQEGGELSAQDIATIAAAANAIIPNINDAMTTLMGTLNTAGYNIRQQAGQFTGIKRNIANATEESITGLAAGVNTQNFYMSYVPIISANVAAIVTYLTGDSTQTSGATPITPTNSELMMGHLDSLDRNLGAMLDLLRQVTTNRDGSFTNSKSLAIRMS